MKSVLTFLQATAIAALIQSVSWAASACPILVGTDNKGPAPVVAIPDPPGSGYIPPGYITDITVNGTKDFTITYTRTSDGVKTTTPATTGDAGVTLSGIADDGWHGTKITSWSFSGNNIRINGTNEIVISGATGIGASQSWGGANGGVQEMVFTGAGGIDLRGYSVVSGQFVIAKAGFSLSTGCKANPAGTLNGNILSLTATPTAGATAVQFYIDNVAAGPLDSSSPFAYTSGPLSAGNHSYHATATWANGSVTSTATTVNVITASTVAAGNNFACAIVNGAVKCWGAGLWGQMGNGTYTVSNNSPVSVTGITAATKISADHTNVCAVENGGVKCWGANSSGILGPTSLQKSNVPVQMIAASSNVTDVEVGNNFACALYSSGMVKCWGQGTQGQMGNGTFTSVNASPVTAVATGATTITTGMQHACAIVSGSMKCWGASFRGVLGNGTDTPNKNTPQQVTGLTSGVTAISGGKYHTCAIHNNVAKCWGYNMTGAIGNGVANGTLVLNPTNVVGLSGTPLLVSAGDEATCAVSTTQTMACWGDNSAGQMGQNTTSASQVTPVVPIGNSSANALVSVGHNNVCSITGGHVKCWGDNSFGQIGDPAAPNPVLAPYQVLGL